MRKLSPKKKINSNSKIKNSTSVKKDGITFKSKLELFTYENLIKNNILNFEYEKRKFVLQENFEFQNDSFEVNKKTKDIDLLSNKIRPITYLPDFSCINDNKEGWVIEVKGFNSDVFPLKWKLFKNHLRKNSYNVTLYKPNNQKNVLKIIELIKQKYYK